MTLTPEQQQYLLHQGVPTGMARDLDRRQQDGSQYFWILDNGGAMLVRDAHLVREHYRNVPGVTRWEELVDTVAYHADLAARFHLPTRYALLHPPSSRSSHNNNNDNATAPLPQYWSIHSSADGDTSNLAQEQQIMRRVMEQTVPAGPSPLTAQLQLLRQHLCTIAPQLRARRQTASIVVATQGLPTTDKDHGPSSPALVQEFVQTLRSLEQLPVAVVIRMCTDEERAFDFYNGLDAHIHLPLDVLDDFYGEALEVYLRNPWLTYGLVLHRYREHGFRGPAVLDVMDERALTVLEIRDLCWFLFWNDDHEYAAAARLPDPTRDWPAFLNAVGAALARERPHWNPVSKAVMPWINLAHLQALYGGRVNVVPPVFPSPQHAPTPFPSQQSSSSFQQPSMPSPPQQQQQQHAQTHPQSHFQQQNAIPRPTNQDKTITTNRNDLLVAVDQTWAKQPPTYATPKPIEVLLETVGSTFALVPSHSYFDTKYHPFAPEALQSGKYDVIKRAVRKMRFFLHPDRLPKDLNESQSLLCRTLWDKISEAWEVYDSNKNSNAMTK